MIPSTNCPRRPRGWFVDAVHPSTNPLVRIGVDGQAPSCWAAALRLRPAQRSACAWFVDREQRSERCERSVSEEL
jgi:hypothetical protein